MSLGFFVSFLASLFISGGEVLAEGKKMSVRGRVGIILVEYWPLEVQRSK